MNGKLMLYLDQNGRPTWAHSVSELCAKLGYSRGSARTMYQDTKDGKATHRVGYVVGRYWLTRFQPVELPA